MDELGRGTSTHDGMAVAQATLEHLVNKVRCLTLFVTHYPEVAALHDGRLGGAAGSYFMAHVVEEQGKKEKADYVPPRVTFLYKVTQGVAGASYGINVARMAGLPDAVVRRAAMKAAETEREIESGGEGPGGLERLLAEVQRGLEGVAPGERGVGETEKVVRELQKRVMEQLQVV